MHPKASKKNFTTKTVIVVLMHPRGADMSTGSDFDSESPSNKLVQLWFIAAAIAFVFAFYASQLFLSDLREQYVTWRDDYQAKRELVENWAQISRAFVAKYNSFSLFQLSFSALSLGFL
jgi:hypothetical protein